MHERSLLMALLHQVHCIQAQNGDADVEEIAVEAGPLSGVEPDLLSTAFTEFTPQHPYARLTIRVVPMTFLCKSCCQTWTMERFASECPACLSTNVQITGGDAFRLLHVTLKDS
ncbi:MAG TPA: hydrogenase maturation nickel metallochaperone HypA [Gemmatales bacterium]|nr:hydrogenase maturation nickel metallochaperone HypA [Gemmatales bacterium]